MEIVLNDEDKKRIKRCDNYQYAKNIMASHVEYKELNIGEVFLIKYKRYSTGNEYSYMSRTYGGKPNKYMVVFKDDEGFAFVKRINASGKLGKEVYCLQTQYPMPTYQLEPDPDYVEAIIFEDEAGYDPSKVEKENTKKKGQARRKNKKLEISFDNQDKAYEFIESLNIGDKMYDSKTSYGDGVIEWTVTNIEEGKVDSSKTVRWGYDPNTIHSQAGFDKWYNVTIECNKDKLPKNRRWTRPARKICFTDFLKARRQKYYKTVPFGLEDV